MDRIRRLPLLIVAVLAVPSLAACGAVAERVAEEALEQEGVEVDIDRGDGDFTVTFEDEDGGGTLTADGESGQVEFESEDGQGTFNSGGGELPEDWPSGYPIPAGATILSSGRFVEADGTSWSAFFEGPPGSFDDYVAHFQGYDTPLLSETESNSGDDRIVTYTWGADDEATAFLVLSDNGDAVTGQLQIMQ